MTPGRRIHKTGEEDFVLRLVQNIFVAELIYPSDQLYLLSAWVTNFTVVDNRTGGLDTLVPHWGRTEIRLADALRHLAEQGTEVFVAVRPSDINRPFVQVIKEIQPLLPPGRLNLQQRPHIHTKGLIGEGFCLSGSFNFTHSGIRLDNEEGGVYTTNAQTVADERIHARQEWEQHGPGTE